MAKKKRRWSDTSITIDPEFQALIPPLKDDEFQKLELSCVEDGIRDALVTWNGILIDGHNRFKIAAKHGLSWTEKKMEFPDRKAARLWILRNQLGRRNLEIIDQIALNTEYEKEIASQQHIGRPQKTDTKSCPFSNETEKTKRQIKRENSTDYKVAKKIGIAEDTYRKGKRLLETGNQQLIGDVRNNIESINSAYQKAFPKKTPYQEKKEFIEKKEQEHKDFQESKTVSMAEVKTDKENRRFLAEQLYIRLLKMGKGIEDACIDAESDEVKITELSQEFTDDETRNIRITFRLWIDELKKMEGYLKNG